MKKSFLFWLYFVLAIILAVYFSVRVITGQMGRGPVSNVQNIITYGTNDKDDEIIKMSLGVSSGQSLRTIDLHQLNNRITNIPGIKKSAVRRLPNGDIAVKIQKHHIVATWSDGENYYPLSSDGTKINTPIAERNENSIVFRGNLPENLTDVIDIFSVLSKEIDYVNYIESRRWNIHTKNGITIYLPEKNMDVAINKINMLNQTHKLLSRKLKIIDMRDSARILIEEDK